VQKRKAQNKSAALTYRKRQREISGVLEAEVASLQSRKQELVTQYTRLEKNVASMRQALASLPSSLTITPKHTQPQSLVLTSQQAQHSLMTTQPLTISQPMSNLKIPLPKMISQHALPNPLVREFKIEPLVKQDMTEANVTMSPASVTSIDAQRHQHPFLAEIKIEPSAKISTHGSQIAMQSTNKQSGGLRLGRTGSSDAGYFSDSSVILPSDMSDSKVAVGGHQRPVNHHLWPSNNLVIKSPLPAELINGAKLTVQKSLSSVSDSSLPRSNSSLPLDPQDRKKEQNRRASKRFRERKKEEKCLGQQQLQDLEDRNAKLKETYRELQNAVGSLRANLLKSSCSSSTHVSNDE